MYYVYHLIDPRNGEVFYIGKGQRDRIDAHEREAGAGVVHPKCDLIRSIWADGHAVRKHKAKSFSSEQAAYDFECAEIHRVGLHRLTNLVSGGGRARRPSNVTTVEIAARLLNYVARLCWMKAKGQKFNEPWNSVAERLTPKFVRDLREKFGEAFVVGELAKYGIEAVFEA